MFERATMEKKSLLSPLLRYSEMRRRGQAVMEECLCTTPTSPQRQLDPTH